RRRRPPDDAAATTAAAPPAGAAVPPATPPPPPAPLRHGRCRRPHTQYLTPHLAQFGAIEISRARYHRLLGDALRYRGVFPRDLPAGAGVLGAAAGVEGAPPGPLQARRLTS